MYVCPGLILLVVSLCILTSCLVLLVKILNSLMENQVRNIGYQTILDGVFFK